MTAVDAGRQARDTGMAAAESRRSAGQDRLVIDQAIAHFTGTGDEFSANDVRKLLPVVSGALIGSRFLQASRAGRIERVGTVQADHEEGHARLLSTWRRAGSKPEASTRQTRSTLLPADGNLPSPPCLADSVPAPRLTPDGEAAVKRAEWALAGGSGKGGLRTVADARQVIRELVDTLRAVTGGGADDGSLF